MEKSNESYSHLLEIDEEKKTLSIYRVYSSGKKILYTKKKFPKIYSPDDQEHIQQFAQILGENLLIDSPAARRLLKL